MWYLLVSVPDFPLLPYFVRRLFWLYRCKTKALDVLQHVSEFAWWVWYSQIIIKFSPLFTLIKMISFNLALEGDTFE